MTDFIKCPWERHVPVWVMLKLNKRYGPVRITAYQTISHGDYVSVSFKWGKHGDPCFERLRISSKDWYKRTEEEEARHWSTWAEIRAIAARSLERSAERAAWKMIYDDELNSSGTI